jgi:flagella basal body P-ring formation protein FlgA
LSIGQDMKFRRINSYLIGLPMVASLLYCSYGFALTSAGAIEQTVRDYLTQRLTEENDVGRFEITFFPLDQRLQLADCDHNLLAKLEQVQPLMGRVSVKVSCELPNQPWSLYTPTYIHIYTPIAVASSILNRNQVITATDIKLVEQDISGLTGGYLTDIQQIAGKTAKRQILAGYPITPQALSEPTMVKKGSNVMIRSSNAHLNVTMEGIALTDGVRGQLISIKNSHSQRIIQATVTGPNTVEIPL